MTTPRFNSRLHGLVVLLLVAAISPEPVVAQIEAFLPPTDTISVVGSCVPPFLKYTIDSTTAAIDSIHIYCSELIVVPRPYTGYLVDHCTFVVRDSLNQNSYSLTFWRDIPWNDSRRTNLVLDEFTIVYAGRGYLSLLVTVADSVVDSMSVMLFADQVGLAEPWGLQPDRPDALMLDATYPNPFNSQTTIRYGSTTTGKLSLTLYNAVGQLMRSLLEADVTAGEYVLPFDSQGLPSGVYFLVLRGHSQAKTARLVLLR